MPDREDREWSRVCRATTGRLAGAPVSAAGPPRGASRSPRWWEHHRVHQRPAGERPVAAPVRVDVRDVLDYFEKCPRCGYPAQASVTTTTFSGGRVESTVFVSCGLPCGWRDVRGPGADGISDASS